MKRGDSGDQPGRGPGLEETLEQPAGPAAGLRRGPRVQRDERSTEPARAGGTRRVVLTVRNEGMSQVWIKESLRKWPEVVRSW